MTMQSYIYYTDKHLPGNRAAFLKMEKEEKEYAKLIKYDNIIRTIWAIDQKTYIDTDLIGLFHCCFIFLNREFTIDTNSDGTYTFQENLENGEINYLIDNCKYQGVFLKKFEKFINEIINN